ncbi:carboxymuconolactone decarboxylase family protein [Marinobacter gelidimuriae]|uniref:carboxymuconolactone decarboxylase family protein n=1 Tax=Marinobacter gelidimuriae TaxID=2739064 RepID=UPI0003719CD0|nr:carboxymuconolactone decarboxylase family protein [Marinobacter gelidimuriae]
MVQITTASIHGCDFCVAGHSAIAMKKAGFNQQQTVALQQRQPIGDERLDALATFTKAVIVNRGAVTNGELESIRKAGFSDEQVLGVVLGISLATLCNFANNIAQNPINPQLQPYQAGVLGA